MFIKKGSEKMIETVNVFGRGLSLYYIFWFLGAVCVIIGGYFLGKKNGFSFAKSILYVIGAVVIGYLLLWGTSWLFNGGKVNGLNFVRIVTFLPVAIYIMARLYEDKFGVVADFIAPLLALFHGVTHIGCIFPGCCHGYPNQWGIFSNAAGTVCFPSQPMEAVSSIVISVLLAVLFLKGKQRGRLYAWYLLIFGTTRFLWEFLRDNDKIWMHVSELAFHALAAAIIGFIALIIIKCHAHKEETHHEK